MKKSIVLLVLVVTFGFRPGENGYQIGDSVSDFKLKNVDGKMVSLSDYQQAKGFIIIFDCNTCPTSHAYNSRIIELHKIFSGQGFPVILINPNSDEVVPEESFEKMTVHAKEHGYDFPYLYDGTQEVVKKFRPTNTPHVFILNKTTDGLKVAYIGAIDNNTRDGSKASHHYVEEAVTDIQSGRAVATPKARAVGCGVRWKNS